MADERRLESAEQGAATSGPDFGGFLRCAVIYWFDLGRVRRADLDVGQAENGVVGAMEWATLLATGIGAVSALAGAILAEQVRHRRELQRGRQSRGRELYVEFITTAGVCHTRLRQLAEGGAGDVDLEAASRAALNDAGIYEAREKLFIDASDQVAGAGQAMFEGLRALRRVVASGATWSSLELHAVYHPYLDAVWQYRAAVRRELGAAPIEPSLFGWPTLNSLAICAVCQPALENG